MCITQFANASSLKKKIRPIASIVWVQGRVEKKRQKGVRKMKKYFCFVLNKYQSVTHVSISIFHGLYKNIVLRYVALVTKKLWAILDFFSKDRTFFPTCTKRYALKKVFKKILSITVHEKSQNLTIIVSKMRVLG